MKMKMYGSPRTFASLALSALLLGACALHPTSAVAQMTSVGIDCSQISALGIMKQDNLGAGRGLLECGVAQGGRPETTVALPLIPPNVRVSTRSCTSSSSCTKSENMVFANTSNPLNIVVNYNDHKGSSYTGTSYSNDGGTTFTEISPAPFASGHGTNYGDPIVVYNSKLGKFFAGDLASGCGSFGIGMWSSPDGMNWTVAACSHNGSNDDRPSIWVDNNPFSRKYGR